MVKAYVGTGEYSADNYTKIEKADFFAGMVNYGQRIARYNAASNGATQVLYTVPGGYTFFLVSMGGAVGLTAANANPESVFLSGSNGEVLIVMKTKKNLIPEAQNMSISLSIPLKVEQGFVFTIQSCANSFTDMNIIGYLVPNSSIPLFS